ncbi:MAG: acyl-CoA dehydrogenase family protein [Thermodesulfobacteriota bacterium]|nr:acyl-CoA dehydrogenase family protein [Thermodesulfobacteriota bacterium]
MDFTISEELKKMQEMARDFTKKEILPKVNEDERNHRFQREIVQKMGKLGFFGCPIPEEYGGNNSGYLAHTLICEEISRISGSLRAAFNMQTMGTALEIWTFGNEEQKQKYIEKLVSAEWLGCICITEPDAGSDVANIKTTAVREGGHYVLNGTKTWITYAQVADVGIVYAYTNKSLRHKGISAFIVDMHTPGISTVPINEKMGWHCCPTGEVVFDNVKVPIENLLGEEGKGFYYTMKGLSNTRITAAAGAVGAGQGLLDESIKYAQERIQFGQPIGKFQMVQEMIGRMVVEVEAARLLTYKVAVLKDQKIPCNLEVSMSKYYACDMASRVADLAIQVLGAYGYSAEYPVERYLRDAKLYQILEGSANIHKMIIANDALGYQKANR